MTIEDPLASLPDARREAIRSALHAAFGAAPIVVWLTDRGVAADRREAHGYGKTRPIASNDTDEGRAQNRRVEIANRGCKAASP